MHCVEITFNLMITAHQVSQLCCYGQPCALVTVAKKTTDSAGNKTSRQSHNTHMMKDAHYLNACSHSYARAHTHTCLCTHARKHTYTHTWKPWPRLFPAFLRSFILVRFRGVTRVEDVYQGLCLFMFYLFILIVLFVFFCAWPVSVSW